MLVVSSCMSLCTKLPSVPRWGIRHLLAPVARRVLWPDHKSHHACLLAVPAAGSKAGYVDYYYAGPVGKRLRSAGEVNQRFKQHADAVQAGPAGQQVHEYLHRCAAAPGQACEEVPGRQEVEGVAAPEALLLLYSRSMAGGWRSKKELLDDVELGQGKGQQEQQRQQQQATSDSQQQLEDAG